jgi:tetratricopeptide (TPR) repeat protein
MKFVGLRMAFAFAAAGLSGSMAQQIPVAGPLYDGRKALEAKDYVQAELIFSAYAKAHPDNANAAMGLGDAALGERRYETAELNYRKATSLQPELWLAHKHLVLVEARLGRWEEFDRERTVLRLAREREAPGITARESDVIDTFDVGGQQWIVREYYEPVGRSQTRYNFERFSANGKVEEYVSLEPAAAAAEALTRDDQVRIGADAVAKSGKEFALNWYTGKGHGVVKRYAGGEPQYEVVRKDVLRWLKARGSS